MLTKKLVRLIGGLVMTGLLLTTLSVSAQDRTQASNDDGEPTLTADYEADVAVEWMTLLYDRIEAERVSAPAGSRLYGYAGVALYEGVVNGMPTNYSMAGQIDHMPDMPLPEEGAVYDWPTVANGSLSTVIAGLFPEDAEETQQAVITLREKQLEERGDEVAKRILDRSIAYGDEIGAELLDWIAEDNFAATRAMTYELPGGWDAAWVPTTEGMVALEPYWGQIRPFALSWADQCQEDMNIEFSTEDGSTFYAQAMEVKNVGDDLTEEQQAIARFWVDTPGVTGTPAGHWVMIENQLVDQLDLTLHRASEMYALVGIALADSFISCWSSKYQWLLLRPETYIHSHIRRSWQPYIQTPPFPEYPSGHSVVSAAAAEVLTTMFGVVAFTDSTHVVHGEAPRSFTSFEAAASEAAISRLYGGIHYRTAIENGMRQGRCVGQRVLNSVQLRPIPQGE